ncbi:substrate-binding domain-containing protein, partial [Streptococcus pneumoniae]
YAIQIATGKDEKERLNAISQMVYGKRVDGLIFLYAQEEDPLVKLVAEEQFPFLILGKSLSPFIPLVDNDNVQAGFDATEYFIKKGCKRIAFIGGSKKLFVTKDRLTGYEQALKHYKLTTDNNRIYFADEFLEEKGYKFSKRLFKHDPQIDAIITTDSLLAEGVCNYIAKHQLDVPVLSFDSVNPKLNLAAYVDINSLELGRVSLETILQIINDNKNNKQICYRQLIAHKIIEK